MVTIRALIFTASLILELLGEFYAALHLTLIAAITAHSQPSLYFFDDAMQQMKEY
jgi:hypothetical protein